KLSDLVRATPSETASFMAFLAASNTACAAAMSAGTGGWAFFASASAFSALVTSSSPAAIAGSGLGGQFPSQRTNLDWSANTLSIRRALSFTEMFKYRSLDPVGAASRTVRLKRSALLSPSESATSCETSVSTVARRYAPHLPSYAASSLMSPTLTFDLDGFALS